MQTSHTLLYSEIEKALRRYKRGVVIRGLSLLLGAITLAVLVIILLRHAWEQFPWLIPVVSVLALAGALALAFRYLIQPLRQRLTTPLIARSIEQKHPELEDRLVTAIEKSGSGEEGIWIERLIQDAISKTQGMRVDREVQVAGYSVWQVVLGASLLALLLIFLNRGSWQPDFDNMVRAGFVPPKPVPELHVQPGDAHLQYGSGLSVQAALKNFIPDEATLFFAATDSSWKSVAMTMEESGDRFGYEFFDLQQEMQYYVKVGQELSDIFRVTLYEAPRLKRLDLTYVYPSYTKLPQRHEQDGGDIWAPVGTQIRLTAHTVRPVISGELLLGEERKAALQMLNDTTLAGSFTIEQDSFYSIRLVNKENLDNAPLTEYYIHALRDQPPSITLKYPVRDVKATMLEEIPVLADIRNDFGQEYARLVVKVNSRDEIVLPLERQKKAAREGQPATGSVSEEYEGLIYLEDLQVRPGDFLTYYVSVKDYSHPEPVKSDMYFVDIRNFEDFYLQATSMGEGMAGGGGASMELSAAEREIITATSRVLQNRGSYSKEEYSDHVEKIRAAQEDVRNTAMQIISSAQMRMNFMGGEGNEMLDELEKAVEAMGRVEKRLKADSLESAMDAERVAYHHLVRAESFIVERQVQMAQQGSGAGLQHADELTRMFQDEMDKLKNKYETLQQGDRTQNQQAVNDALQKLRELSRRQQNINETSRQLAQRNLNEEEKKREVQKLERQQEQLRRDTEEAFQQMAEALRNQQGNSSSSEDMRRASSAMNQARNNLRKQEPQNAAASGEQALDQLRQAEERLRKMQNNALREDVKSLQEQMESLARRQQRLADSTRSLSQQRRSGAADSSLASANLNEQQRLRGDVQSALNDLRNAGRGNEQGQESQNVQRDLQKLGQGLDQRRVADRMQQIESALRTGRESEAEAMQRAVEDELAKAAERLRGLASRLDGSDEERLQQALRQAQDLRRELEEQLRQRAGSEGEQQRQAGQQAQGEQQGQAEQSGEQGQSERQGEGERLAEGSRPQGQAGGSQSQGSGGIGNPPTSNSRLTQQEIESLRELMWRSKEQLEEMRRQLHADSSGVPGLNELQADTDNLINSLSGMVRTFRGGDRERLRQIEELLIDPLVRIESELAGLLQVMRSKEQLRSVREQPVSPEYKEMIEEYYRALAESKKNQSR